LKLTPISIKEAKAIFKAKTSFRGDFDFAISVRDAKGIHGVIAMTSDGKECRLAHLYTDANAQVGSLLYGGAWRVAKALGYQRVWI
jgi:hypothetical protein